MIRARLAAFVAAVLLVLSAGAASADGRYEFLVFSLSWSPSFCEAAGDDAGRIAPEECGFFARPRAFVVHGLWPLGARGFPEYCLTPPPRLDKALVDGMLDLMPSRDHVEQEWAKHGTCSGLEAAAYFALVREVRALIRVPTDMTELYTETNVSPAAVERMFRNVNPGLDGDEISVTCERRRLREVRICLDRDLNFRACPEIVERRACKSDWIMMPASRVPIWR